MDSERGTQKQNIVLISCVNVTVTGGRGSKQPVIMQMSYVNGHPTKKRSNCKSDVGGFFGFGAHTLTGSLTAVAVGATLSGHCGSLVSTFGVTDNRWNIFSWLIGGYYRYSQYWLV